MDLPELFNAIRNILKNNSKMKYQRFYWGDDMCSFIARKKIKGWIEIWLLEDHILFSNVFKPGRYQGGTIQLYTESIKKELRTIEEFYDTMQELVTQEYFIMNQNNKIYN